LQALELIRAQKPFAPFPDARVVPGSPMQSNLRAAGAITVPLWRLLSPAKSGPVVSSPSRTITSVAVAYRTVSNTVTWLPCGHTRIARRRLLEPSANIFQFWINGQTDQHAARLQREERIDAGVLLDRSFQAGKEGVVESVNIREKSVQSLQSHGFAAQIAPHKMHCDDPIHRLSGCSKGRVRLCHRPHAPEYRTCASGKNEPHQGAQGSLCIGVLACFVLRRHHMHINPVYRRQCGKPLHNRHQIRGRWTMRARGVGKRAMWTFVYLEARPRGQVTARDGAVQLHIEAVAGPGFNAKKIDDCLDQ
jgi:hypothetical protein